MKKRILAGLLVLSLVLLTACGSFEIKPTTTEKLVAATEKYEALDAYAVDLDFGIGIDISGTTFDLPLQMEIKAVGAKSETPLTYAKSTFTMLGQTVVTEAYEYDGYTYTVAATGNYKTPTVGSANGYASMGSLFTQIPEETANKNKFKSNADGTETVEIAIPDAVAMNVFAPVINNTSEVTDASSATASVTGGKVTVTLKDGYLHTYKLSFVMNATVSGMATTYNMNVTANYSAPGDAISVELPAGYENFPNQ